MAIITKIEANIPNSSVKKIKVAAYARVSTDSYDQLLSLETQKEHYENYIKANPSWDYVGLYFDEGISGTKVEKRASLIRLLRDCELGKIDRVITKSISRFSRNTINCLEMVRKLTSLGIYIYFEKENIDTEHMSSELMLSILSSIAESESKSISDNIKWSIKNKFKEGTYIIQSPPYGYKNINGKMVKVPEEAKVVKEIFKLALNGNGAHTIAKLINEKGFTTRKKCKWHPSTIRAILKNEKYTGDALLQKTYTDENFNRHENKGEVSRYYVKDHHEAIISHEDYDLVQDLTHQRGSEKGINYEKLKNNKRYAFSGKIVCGECGSNFKRKIQYKSGDNNTQWVCKLHNLSKEKCSMKCIDENDIKESFVKMINKLKVGNEIILKPFLNSLNKSKNTSNFKEIKDIDIRLEELKHQQEEILQLLKNEYISRESYFIENNKLSIEKDSLENEKEHISNFSNTELIKIKETQKLIKFISKSKNFSEFSDDQFLEFVERVIVVKRNKLIFQLKCGLNLTEEV